MGRFIEQNLPMKNFLFLLCILSLCFGCDKAYDLNKIESGDVTIGNDQSEWIMPLAQITVGMDELYEGENETYIEASAENSGSTLYDKEIRDKPRTRHTKRNV